MVVLDTLAPAERLAFVPHDIFAVPFEEIAAILDCSPAAARQLASRARRRVHGTAPPRQADLARQRQVVDAFLAALRDGDSGALLAVLDPDIVFRDDSAAPPAGAPSLMRGAPAVAGYFSHTWLDRGGAEGDLMELNGWTSPQMLRRYGASARSARARRSYDRVMDDMPQPAAPSRG